MTAGFYSKDLILWQAWSSPTGGLWLWLAGLFGAFITSLYTFRMVFITFFGEEKIGISMTPGARMIVPLVVLALLSIVGGFVELPDTLGNLPLFSNFLSSVFPDTFGACCSKQGTALADRSFFSFSCGYRVCLRSLHS